MFNFFTKKTEKSVRREIAETMMENKYFITSVIKSTKLSIEELFDIVDKSVKMSDEAKQKAFYELRLAENIKPGELCKPEKPDLPPKKRLKNMIEFAKSLGTNDYDCGKNHYGLHPVHSFVKILTDKIMVERIEELIEFDYIDDGGCKAICRFFSHDKAFRYTISPIFEQINDVEFTVELASFPVLACVHKAENFQDCFKNIPENKGKWIEDKNHQTETYLPLGLTIAVNGNHSITTGKFKACGSLRVTADGKNAIYGMRKLYDVLKFDGENYIFSYGATQITVKAASFEFGCIFEIGRMLLEAKMPFCGYLPDGTKEKLNKNS